MPAEIPVPGPIGPLGPIGPPGPALAGGTRKYSGSSGAGAQGYSTPDDASLDFADNFSLRALILPNNWATGTQQYVVGKSNTVSNQRSYHLDVATDGRLIFQWSPDGTAALVQSHFSSISVPSVLRGNEPVWIRADFSGTTGPSSDAVVTFYYAEDLDNDGWILLGTAAVRNSGHVAGGPFNSTAQATVGQQQTIGTTPFVGRIYMAEYWDITTPLTPALHARLDVRGLANGSSTFTDPTGKVWTPLASTTLFSDETSLFDFRTKTLAVNRLIPGMEGSILQVSGQKAQWLAPGGGSSTTLSVTSYGGAVGDGSTDDTTAFALTIAALQAVGGGIMYVPKPTNYYKITGAIDFNNVQNITMRGDGKKQSIIKWAGGYGSTTTNSMVLIRGTSANIIVEHVGFDGQKTLLPKTTTAGGVQALSTSPVSLQVASTAGWPASGTFQVPDSTPGPGNPGTSYNWVTVTYTSIVDGTHFGGATLASGTASVPNGSTVMLTQGGLGIQISATGGDVRVRFFRVTNCYNSGFFNTVATDVEITNGQIDNNGVHQIIEAMASFVGNGIRSSGMTRLSIRNCWIFGNANTGISHPSTSGTSTYVEITGNMVYNNGFIGIAGGPQNTNLLVTNNRCMNQTNNNIDMGGCSDYTVSNNTCVGGRIGIDVDGGAGTNHGSGGVITGNTVRGTLVRHGIEAINFTDITITNNSVHNSWQNGINVTCGLGGLGSNVIANAVIEGNTVSNSGQDGTGTRSGIVVGTLTTATVGVTDVSIVGNRCYDNQGTKTQQYGVVTYGLSDYVVLTGNTLRGNAVGGSSLVGANNQVGVNA